MTVTTNHIENKTLRNDKVMQNDIKGLQDTWQEQNDLKLRWQTDSLLTIAWRRDPSFTGSSKSFDTKRTFAKVKRIKLLIFGPLSIVILCLTFFVLKFQRSLTKSCMGKVKQTWTPHLWKSLILGNWLDFQAPTSCLCFSLISKRIKLEKPAWTQMIDNLKWF